MNTEESLSVREHPKMPRLADYRLIAFDMDSTLINIECVDEIADAVNKKEEVAAITEAAMQGIISDYKESLRQRVALLKGVPEHTLQAIYDERLQLNPGAEALMDACKQAGLKTLLVSGGFTFFTERIRTRLGVDFTRANKLEIENGALTGRILPQPWGDICDGVEKARTLLEVAALMGISFPAACSTTHRSRLLRSTTVIWAWCVSGRRSNTPAATATAIWMLCPIS